MKEYASLPLRLALGIVFVAHGLQKTFGLFAGTGMYNFTSFIATLGFKPPIIWAYLAAYTELFCGILVLVGLFTRASCLLLLTVMLVAIKIHLGKGFFAMDGGFEYPLVLALACLALFLNGSGKFSITKN